MTSVTTGQPAESELRVTTPCSFKTLIAEERRHIDGAKRPPLAPISVRAGDVDHVAKDIIPKGGPADEPWVAFTNRDYFGLALSGGGIRSATFNLGVLQALEQFGVLGHIDYLSTVSGGGYIGGFWSAFRHQRSVTARVDETGRRGSSFPLSSSKLEAHWCTAPAERDVRLSELVDRREPPQIRHLREFSRFLMPRVGFQHAETWGGIVALLGGLLPSVLAAGSLLAVTIYAWYAVTYGLASVTWHGGVVSAFGLAGLTLVLHCAKETSFRSVSSAEHQSIISREMWVVMTASSLVAGAFYWVLREHWLKAANDVWLRNVRVAWQGAVVVPPLYEFAFALFVAPAAWATTGLALALFRGFGIKSHSDPKRRIVWSNAYERASARHLVYALSFVALGLSWEIARYLLKNARFGFSVTASGSIGFAALFAWIRTWLSKPIEPTQGSKIWERVIAFVKPILPQLAANGAFLSMFVGVSLIIVHFNTREQTLLGVGISFGIVVFSVFFFDPASTGLHDFYRSRIARCFLGAARVDAQGATLRITPEQPDDDVTLSEIRANCEFQRPIHLICCAANSLSGDVLGSLYRGARSAALSPLAISIGGHAVTPPKDLRLSSALTASAAAFNSQMGNVSMRLGPAVAFLMSALNLRLGLWVPHPLKRVSRRFNYLRGLPFYLEMLGLTKCDPVKSAAELGLFDQQVHLSDGGHFENLGLYELVRRHCRYIIVSDCGADEGFRFDDLGNAIRRIREDFNVEIEMVTAPLANGENGVAVQHAVVGTIHYDGPSGTDKGLLLYLKPTLTGDEPPDVLQYHVTNATFPHEATGDQFYDEAQWESYRRLGEHTVHSVLRSLEDVVCQGNPVDRLFLEASQRWHPQLDQQREIYQDLNQRCVDFLATVEQNAPLALRLELFPEVAATLRDGTIRVESPSVDETTRVLFFLMLGLQLMEDAWVAAKLDTFWSHPLNEGWMHFFERWASCPSLRRYWPMLRPMYSPGFRDFVRDRFNLRLSERARDESHGGATLRLYPLTPEVGSSSSLERMLHESGGFVWQQWTLRRNAPHVEGKRALLYELSFDSAPDSTLKPLDVGLLLYEKSEEGDFVEWKISDLYVPPSLNGAGIVARFLDAVVRYFVDETLVRTIVVVVDEVGLKRDPRSSNAKNHLDAAGRQARIHDISFYKSRGFTYTNEPGATGQPRALTLDVRTQRELRQSKTSDVCQERTIG